MGAQQSKTKRKPIARPIPQRTLSSSTQRSQPLPEPPPLLAYTRPILMERDSIREVHTSYDKEDTPTTTTTTGPDPDPELDHLLQTRTIQPTVRHVLPHPPDFLSTISLDSTSTLDSLRSSLFSSMSTSYSSISSASIYSKAGHPTGSSLHNRDSIASNASTFCLPIQPPATDATTKLFASLLKEATTTHDPALRTYVAHCKLQGYGTPTAIHQGFQELKQIAETTHHINALYSLGLCYYHGLTFDRQKDYALAYQWFLRASTTEQSTTADTVIAVCLSQYYLGYMLSQGQGVATDAHQAIEYFEKAAVKGHHLSQHIVGWHYQTHGHLIKARDFYLESAQQGYADAQAAFGIMLLDDTKVFSQDTGEEAIVQEALQWLNKAARQNNPRALLKLGSLYAQGLHVERRLSHAASLYEKAGLDSTSPYYGTCHYMLGLMYRSGEAQNLDLALRHLSLSAGVHHRQANRVLGLMYYQGIGVPKDVFKARLYFESAAAKGDAYAYGLLAEQAETGRGCPQSQTQALELYEKASAAGALTAYYSKAMLLHRMDRRTEAYEWFLKASQQKTTEKETKQAVYRAHLMLARYHINGWGQCVRNPMMGFEELLHLTRSGDFWEAHYWVGAAYEEGIHTVHGQPIIEPNLVLAFDYYEKGARHGDVDLMHKVARMLANGFTHQSTTIKDQVRAFEWYTKAAKGGHPTAEYSLGLYYANGLAPLTSSDTPRALECYRSAAQKGLPDAMVSLAQLSIDTKSEDSREALEWLFKAAKLNHPAGLRELAAAYQTGVIRTSSQQERYSTAFQLLTKAIELKNDPLSWCALSLYYENGWAVVVSLDKALACLEKARSLGHAKATVSIAELFERNSLWNKAWQQYDTTVQSHILKSALGWKSRLGKARLLLHRQMGTEKDRKQILGWLQEMSLIGSGESFIEPFTYLGIFYEMGFGVSKDMQKAIVWFNKALEQPTGGKDIHWIQENSRFHLARLYCQHQFYVESLRELRRLENILEQMNHHSSETMVQARQVRYYLGYVLLHGSVQDRNTKEAIMWLEKAADEGEGSAIYELGLLAMQAGNEKAAETYFERGRAMNHAGCIRELALYWLHENKDDIQWEGREVYELLEEAALLNDTEALYQLGLIHERGLSKAVVQNNLIHALEYYRKAAQQGHEQAIEHTVKACESLEQTEEAVVWLQKISTRPYARVLLASYRLKGKGGLNVEEKGGLAELKSTAQDLERIEKSSQDIEALGMAYFFIGECFENGQGTTKDDGVSMTWYIKAANTSENIVAMHRLGTLYSQQGNEESAFEWYGRAAARGNHKDSQYQLGLFHANGLAGLSANMIAAKMYFGKAAKQGHLEATYELGNILWQQEDFKEAIQLFEVASKANVPEALRRLGNIYHQGYYSSSKAFHIAQDYGRALDYFRQAAKLNDGTAALMVGSYYEEGFVSPSDVSYERSLQWYREAHRLGCGPLADLAIANLLYTRAEDTQDMEEAKVLRSDAFVWFQGASKLNNETGTYARITVALYYLNGWGNIKKNEVEGFQQLLLIAKDGGRDAFSKVATCYENGVGVEVSKQEALFWWSHAAEFEDDVEAIERVGYYHKHGLGGLPANPVKAQEYYDKANNYRNGQLESEPSFISSRASIASY